MREIKAHSKADELTKGSYWDGKRGCFIGCAISHKQGGESWHDAFERMYGIDNRLARLFDDIFENLPRERAIGKWSLQVYAAIKPGADVSKVAGRFLFWLLSDPDMVLKHADAVGKKAIRRCAKLFDKRLAGKESRESDWSAAESAAWSVARSAACSAARSAAWSAAYEKMADKLLEMLAACEPVIR